jgi:hypothetical protein
MASKPKLPYAPLVAFLVGDGSGKIYLPVIYWAQFPRGIDGTCAFCNGDPCAEGDKPESEIAKYFERAKAAGRRPESCPICDGRAT